MAEFHEINDPQFSSVNPTGTEEIQIGASKKTTLQNIANLVQLSKVFMSGFSALSFTGIEKVKDNSSLLGSIAILYDLVAKGNIKLVSNGSTEYGFVSVSDVNGTNHGFGWLLSISEKAIYISNDFTSPNPSTLNNPQWVNIIKMLGEKVSLDGGIQVVTVTNFKTNVWNNSAGTNVFSTVPVGGMVIFKSDANATSGPGKALMGYAIKISSIIASYVGMTTTNGANVTPTLYTHKSSSLYDTQWTELGSNTGGMLGNVKVLTTSFWNLISSNDTDIQAFVIRQDSPEVPTEYRGEGFGFARHYQDDVGMATVTIKLNSGGVKTFNVTFYGDGSDAYWEETGGSSGKLLPFDGPIPGYELVYSNTNAVLQLGSETHVTINFNKTIPISQISTSKARFMIEAEIVLVSGSTQYPVTGVPIAIFKPTVNGQPAFEYMIQSIATVNNIAKVRLLITSWIREAGSTGDITGCMLKAQVNNLNSAHNYALTFPGIYVKQ